MIGPFWGSAIKVLRPAPLIAATWRPPPADGVLMRPGEERSLPRRLRPRCPAARWSTSPPFLGHPWPSGTQRHDRNRRRPRSQRKRQVLDSITFRADATNSPVSGRCPPPDPTPPTMPTPTRLTPPMVIPGNDAQMLPEPADVQPKVGAASVWASIFDNFGAGGFAGPSSGASTSAATQHRHQQPSTPTVDNPPIPGRTNMAPPRRRRKDCLRALRDDRRCAV